jgi:hypothetical protein
MLYFRAIRFKLCKSIVFLAFVLSTAVVTNAALITNVTTEAINGDPHVGIIAATANDLLGLSVTNTSYNCALGSSPDVMTDGIIRTSDAEGRFNAQLGDYIAYDLESTVNSSGYTISNVTVVSHWGDRRANQYWTVQFRPVGGSFTDFASVAVPANGTVTKVELADDGGAALANGIDGIRINFANGWNNWAVYREIDIVGSAVPIAGPPLAVNDVATTPYNTPVDVYVLLNDNTGGSSMGIASVDASATNISGEVNGSVSYTPGNDYVTCSPAGGNFFGDLFFNYVITNASGSATGQVTVTVDTFVVQTVTTESINGDPHVGAITNVPGDLLETVVSSSTSSAVAGDPLYLTNDTIETGEDFFGAQTGNYVEYVLDTEGTVISYDITAIRVVTCDSGYRAYQEWAVSVRPVGGSFTTLYTMDGESGASGVNLVELTSLTEALAFGIDAIRFDFIGVNGDPGTWAKYREIEVVGAPALSSGGTVFRFR